MKYILALFFIIFSLSSKAQITLAGADSLGTNPYIGAWPSFNGVYTKVTGFYETNPFYYAPLRDSGIDSYQQNVNGNQYQNIISRYNRKWVIMKTFYGPYNYIIYRTVNAYNTTLPPCNAVCEELDNSGWYQRETPYTRETSLGVVSISLTGSCINVPPPPVQALVLSPFSLSLPQLTNALILALNSPSSSSMVWSIDDSCVKVFDGTSSNCL